MRIMNEFVKRFMTEDLSEGQEKYVLAQIETAENAGQNQYAVYYNSARNGKSVYLISNGQIVGDISRDAYNDKRRDSREHYPRPKGYID